MCLLQGLIVMEYGLVSIGLHARYVAVVTKSERVTPDDGPRRRGGALRVFAEADGVYGVVRLSPPVYCS